MSKNRPSLTNVCCLSVLLFGVACFVGCPDYSHLRPQPDYSNMTDSGAEEVETDLEKNR